MNILNIIIWLLLIVNFWRKVFMWDMQFIIPYVLTLTRVKKAQEINWFISERLDTESTEQFHEFFNTIHRNSQTTQMVVTNNSEIRIVKSFSKRKFLSVVMTTGLEDPILQIQDRVLRGRHFFTNFVVLVKPLKDFNLAERLLRLLHRYNFQQTLLYVSYLNGSSELLGFNQFPNFTLQVRTNILKEMKENSNQIQYTRLDCQGLELYTPLRLDLPGVFRYINKQNVIENHGVAFQILQLYSNYINASLVPYEMPKDKLGGDVINMKDTFKLLRDKKIKITAHAYALFNPDDEIDKSFSLLLVRWCLMVPIRNTVSTIYYPIKPFEKQVWFMLLVVFIALAITDVMWLVWESQKKPKLRRNLILQVQINVLNNLCYILNITASKNIKRPSRIRFALYTTVFVHAFFISAGYTSLLGSILTVTLFRENINTIEDLIKANISAMIIDYEHDFLLQQHLDLPHDFLRLLKPVDPATFHLHQSTFNQSYAYFITDDRWAFLRQQQEGLKPGLFKFTNICFGTFQNAFPLEIDSPLWRSLKYFILRFHSSGLLHIYRKMSFEHALRAGYMQHFKSHKEYQAAGLSHMSMIFLMLLIMSFVCVFIFLCELLHYRLNRRK